MRPLPPSLLVLAPAWLAYCYLAGQAVSGRSLWFFLLALLPVALPLCLAGWYGATVRRIRRAQLFHQQGPLFGLFTGRFFAYTGWILWALASAGFMLLYLGTARLEEWLALLVAVPLYAALFLWGLGRARRELRGFVASHFATRAARWMTALSIAAGLVALALAAPPPAPGMGFVELVAQQRHSLPEPSNSALMERLVEAVATTSALRDLVALRTGENFEPAYVGLLFCGYFALVFNVGLALAAFVLPGVEYRRLLLPCTDVEEPSTLPASRVALAAGLTSFLLLFLYLPGGAYLEAWLRSDAPVPQALSRTSEVVVERVDQIDGRYHQAGTVQRVRELQEQFLRDLDVSTRRLLALSDAAHAGMQANVADYLDWYYSLPAEYLRIGALLTGQIEQLMAEKLGEYLSRGEALRALEVGLGEVTERRAELREQYDRELQALLSATALRPEPGLRIEVAERLPTATALAPPTHPAMVGLEGRAIASGGAALLGSIVAGKVVAKVISKGTLKLGAKALVKVASGKALGGAGGAAGGAALGAAVGSVVPGVGTAVGAAVGGALGGILVGISVEALLLMLEEAFARADFERDLREAIEASRQEMAAELSAPGRPRG